MTLQLPSPEDRREDHSEPADAAAAEPREERRQKRGTQSNRIPTLEEAQLQLLQLNSLVAVGLLAPNKANIIQRNLRTIIDVHMKQQQTAKASGAATPEDLAALYRADPKVLDVMAPFLTPETVAWLLRQDGHSAN